MFKSTVGALILAFSAIWSNLNSAMANENVVGRPRPGLAISEQDSTAAQVQTQRILTDPTKLSQKLRDIFHITVVRPFGLPPEQLDGKSHPFTTKNASAEGGISPVDLYPWRATGKMFMRFGPSVFQCTASVIGSNLLVTAAHCVHNFGGKEGGFADSLSFEPARHSSAKPFGTWVGKEWWIPKAYFDGTDICSPTGPGVVCENDLAIVVLEKNNGQSVANLTGKYGFKSDDYGYGSIFGNKATQITLLGYPADHYDGLRMVRTDSLGYQDSPNNVIIGSSQTAGSSGGPWLQNFGVKTSYSGTQPLNDDDNQVVATTSWGFTSDRIMVQGASRFGKNITYTIKSNIQSLFDTACAANQGFC